MFYSPVKLPMLIEQLSHDKPSQSRNALTHGGLQNDKRNKSEQGEEEGEATEIVT